MKIVIAGMLLIITCTLLCANDDRIYSSTLKVHLASDKAKTLECVICKQIAIQPPYYCSGCKINYVCLNCYNSTSFEKCPTCSRKNVSVVGANTVENDDDSDNQVAAGDIISFQRAINWSATLRLLVIVCENESCLWSATFNEGDFESKDNSGITLYREHIDQCPEALLACPEECQKKFKRCDLEKHQQYCPQ